MPLQTKIYGEKVPRNAKPMPDFIVIVIYIFPDTICGFTVEYRAGVFGSRGVDENGYFEDMLDLCVWQVDSGDDKFVSRLIVLHMNITCDNSLEVDTLFC